MSTQTEKLSERYEALKATGAVDIKFMFGPLRERALDDVCTSVNEVLDAIAADDYVEFPLLGDSRRPKE